MDPIFISPPFAAASTGNSEIGIVSPIYLSPIYYRSEALVKTWSGIAASNSIDSRMNSVP